MKKIEIDSIVEKDGVIGYVMNMIDDTAFIWWRCPGRYRIEPHNVETLVIIEEQK